MDHKFVALHGPPVWQGPRKLSLFSPSWVAFVTGHTSPYHSHNSWECPQETMCLVDSPHGKYSHIITQTMRSLLPPPHRFCCLTPSVNINHPLVGHCCCTAQKHSSSAVQRLEGTSSYLTHLHIFWWLTAVINKLLLPTMSSHWVFHSKQQNHEGRKGEKQRSATAVFSSIVIALIKLNGTSGSFLISFVSVGCALLLWWTD